MSATPLAARLAAVMIAVLLAASMLTVSLNALKLRKVQRVQNELVYAFVASELRDTIEDSMNLGLPLAALQTTQKLIQRRRAAEASIAGITVLDANRRILFDTDRFRVGAPVPAEWLPGRAQSDSWSAELPDMLLAAAGITSNFGEDAGGVVVRYDPRAAEARMTAMLLSLVRVALVTLAAAAALAAFAAYVLARPLRRWFAQASAEAETISLGTARHSEPLRQPEIATAIGRAYAALDRAEQDLMCLGTDDERAA